MRLLLTCVSTSLALQRSGRKKERGVSPPPTKFCLRLFVGGVAYMVTFWRVAYVSSVVKVFDNRVTRLTKTPVRPWTGYVFVNFAVLGFSFRGGCFCEVIFYVVPLQKVFLFKR